MSASKDMWMDAIGRIGEDYCADRITLEEGIAQLKRLGFDANEAKTMLDEAIS